MRLLSHYYFIMRSGLVTRGMYTQKADVYNIDPRH